MLVYHASTLCANEFVSCNCVTKHIKTCHTCLSVYSMWIISAHTISTIVYNSRKSSVSGLNSGPGLLKELSVWAQ